MQKTIRILALILALIMVCSMTALAVEPTPACEAGCTHEHEVEVAAEAGCAHAYVTSSQNLSYTDMGDGSHIRNYVITERCTLCGDSNNYYDSAREDCSYLMGTCRYCGGVE